jgi:hypothetical protein
MSFTKALFSLAIWIAFMVYCSTKGCEIPNETFFMGSAVILAGGLAGGGD